MRSKITIYTAILFICYYFSSGCSNEKPKLSFGIMTDVQYCSNCEPEGSIYHKNSLKKLDEAIQYFNRQEVPISLHLGDIIDRNFSDLDSVLLRFDNLNNRIINITGNHDYYAEVDNSTLYDKLSMDKEYFTVDLPDQNWQLIFLNTNELASYSNITDTLKQAEYNDLIKKLEQENRISNASGNGGISMVQMNWMDSILEIADKKNIKILIFSHHPIYLPNRPTALNDKEILSTIEKYDCVKALFAGHHHSGGFEYYKDIPFVTLEGIVETKNKNSFGLIHLYDQKIVIEGKGLMKSRTIKIR